MISACICYSLLLAMNAQSQEKLNIEERRLTEQRLTASLFTKTKAALVNGHNLNKYVHNSG